MARLRSLLPLRVRVEVRRALLRAVEGNRLVAHAFQYYAEKPMLFGPRTHPGNRSRNLDIHVAPGELVLGRLFADPDTPERIRAGRREIYAHFYTMLAGGALKVGRYGECGRWAIRALRSDPRSIKYIAELPVRRASRFVSGVVARRRGGVPGIDRPPVIQAEG
jgi:hypothetical protein